MTWSLTSFLQMFLPLYSMLITIYLPACSAYNLAREYRGLTFYDTWDFFVGPDVLTHGDVNWLDKGNAFNSQLAYVNEHYNAIMKVDNGYVPFGGKRNSIRMATQDPFYVGTLLIADFVHLPFGCSVWPAFWSTGPTWPDNGEIDIIEQINMATNNQMALHSLPGCFQSNPGWQTGISGGQYQTGQDCSTAAGCVVEDTSSASFGPNFAVQGGGVWAAQFDVQGVFIWFWSRPSIPPALTAAVAGTGPIELSTWGPPSAAYMATGCNITEFFAPQKLILDITLCGDWAGEPTNYARTCGGHGPTGKCYDDNVPGDGANYDNAYFEISYIRTYTTGGAGPLPTPAVAGAVWNSLTATAASTTVTSFGTLHAHPTGSGASVTRSSSMAPILISASILGGLVIGAFMGL